MGFVGSAETDGRVVVQSVSPRDWKVMERLRYVGDVDTFVVPVGFITDFASVPRILGWLIPTYGRWTRPAILHDWLWRECIPARMISSVDTDGLFRRALREEGVPPVKRWLMWAGVRWGALFEFRRRSGWLSTAPAVLAITAAAVPFLIVPVLAVLAGMAAYGIAEFVASRGRSVGTLHT